MAVNKNFVVKNGVEVATDLIYAESSTNRVGFGTTTPGAKLHVIGNIVGSALTLSGSLDAGNAVFTGIATANDGLYVGSGGTALHIDVGSNTIGINSSSPDSNFSLDVQPGAGQSAATLGGALDVQGNTWINGNLKVNGGIEGSFTVDLDNPVITGVVTANNAEIFTQFDIINNSNLAYQFQATGIGFTQNTDNPTLFLNRGQKYHFSLNASGHPFYIKTAATTGVDDQYENGVDGQGTQVGVVTFYVPYNAPSELYYQCGAHVAMGNTMYVLKEQSPQAVELNITDLNVSGLSTFVGVSTFSSTANFGAATGAKFWDNKKLVFGEDDDLEIYHDGTDAYLDNDTGHLYIRNNVAADVGGNIYLRPHDNEEGIVINDDGNVELYYDNSKKLETTNEGILVTGIATATTLVGGGQTINATGIDVTGVVTATSFTGDLTGNVTGNADTATALATARALSLAGDVTASGVNFDGSGAVELTTAIAANTVGVTELNVTEGTSGQFLQTDGAGTLTFATVSTPTLASLNLDTTDDVQFDSFGVGTAASGTTGEIRATNDVTAFYSSDVALKEDITNISNPLEAVDKLNGVLFNWKQSYIDQRGGEDGYFVRKKDVGVIAQDVEKVLPEAVATRPDGVKAVKYDRLTCLLIEAVKALKLEIEELKK